MQKDVIVRVDPEAIEKANKVIKKTKQSLKGYVSIAVSEKAEIDIKKLKIKQ